MGMNPLEFRETYIFWLNILSCSEHDFNWALLKSIRILENKKELLRSIKF